MFEFSLPVLFYISLLFLSPQPAHLPDHPLYNSYTYSFSLQDKQIIAYHVKKAKNILNTYKWPTNTKSAKVNNFFRILNDKSYDSQYNRAILFILNLVPDLIDTSKEDCWKSKFYIKGNNYVHL